MGTDKLMLEQDGTTVLEQAVLRYSSVFDRVCISVAGTNCYAGIAAEHIPDEYPGCGPMAGIQAGLKRCGGEGAFFAAADLPFSDPFTARLIMEKCPQDAEICVPVAPDGRPEPLFGFYRPSVLPRAEELLRSGRFRMRELLDACATRYFGTGEEESVWSEVSLANMNTPEDYRRLLGGDPFPKQHTADRE